MNLLDIARQDNHLFFSPEGFTTVAVIRDGVQVAHVECFFSRTEETVDKMSRIPITQQTAQVTFHEATVPVWFGKSSSITLTDSSGELLNYKVEQINRDRMLGRVHVYLSLADRKGIPIP